MIVEGSQPGRLHYCYEHRRRPENGGIASSPAGSTRSGGGDHGTCTHRSDDTDVLVRQRLRVRGSVAIMPPWDWPAPNLASTSAPASLRAGSKGERL